MAKWRCDECLNHEPCLLDMQEEGKIPSTCPYSGTDCEWHPVLTLDEALRYCVNMWNDLPDPLPEGFIITRFKSDWLSEHGFENCYIENDCFFCEYANQQEPKARCAYCPGVLIDITFSCVNEEYHWSCKPLKFRDKLRELYERYKKSIEKNSKSES
jgi:hypothetical protein